MAKVAVVRYTERVSFRPQIPVMSVAFNEVLSELAHPGVDKKTTIYF